MLFLGPIGTNYLVIFQEIIKDLNLEDHVTYFGKVDYSKIPIYLQLASLGLFLAQPVHQRYNWTEPIKYFEYMAAGVPVVISDLPAHRRLIEKIGNGILVDPLDYQRISEQIRSLLDNSDLRNEMRKKGFLAFHDEYNWENIALNMVRSLHQIGA